MMNNIVVVNIQSFEQMRIERTIPDYLAKTMY